jgi:hypothetical protein
MVTGLVTGIHKSRARIGVDTRQDRGAGADLVDPAGTADDAIVGQRVTAVEGQRGIVDHIRNDTAAGAAVADLQGAGDDLPGRRMGAGADQRPGAGACLLEGIEVLVLRADRGDIEGAVCSAAQTEDVIRSGGMCHHVAFDDRS